ncbi:hypothetical protein BG006_001058 [Podila minutissima]|uniref:Uncharacterized protein n=1 Tax=Podila minutissima TaxID=64525 RepID=A0A9P5VR83_9FUNG|nr:hypothetical protein BG006_001058 [Podila minutissima]
MSAIAATIINTSTFDPKSTLSSKTAMIDPAMTKQQILELGQELDKANIRLRNLSFNEAYKDSQEALVSFLSLPCCSALEFLEYKSAGSSFAKIVLSSAAPSVPIKSTELTVDDIHTRVPFIKTLKTLRLGYNADEPQGECDIGLLKTFLHAMPQLEVLSLSQSLDDFTLFESVDSVQKSNFLPKLTSLSVAVNTERCLLDEEEVRRQVRQRLCERDDSLHIDIELTERESSYYLNQSRDRHFQAFVRRFGGERKQQ